MSTFGPHAYEDLALLNAQWQQARPAVAGLGGVAFGQHEYRDLSYLNARLRPILPAEVGMPPPSTLGYGNGTLSGNSIGVIAGLGADPNYPWMEYSADTKALQDQLNVALKSNGYAPITADGTLGAGTCGAIREMCGLVDPPCTAPGTCQSFTAPTKLGGSAPIATPATSNAGMFGTGGGTNWMLWGGAVAAIAVGGALIFKASKKR